MNIHHHLIVRAEVAKPPLYNDVENTNNWMKDLINRINMNILNGPNSIYCVKEGNRGMTSFAIIDTSHIALHTWDEEAPFMLQLDVYSCAEFNINDVISSLDVYDPIHIDYKFLDRTDNFIVVK